MLHPETKRIADELTGYVPFTEEECQEQFPAPVNYDPLLFNQEDENTHPITGCIFKDPGGKLQCFPVTIARMVNQLSGWSGSTSSSAGVRQVESSAHSSISPLEGTGYHPSRESSTASGFQ